MNEGTKEGVHGRSWKKKMEGEIRVYVISKRKNLLKIKNLTTKEVSNDKLVKEISYLFNFQQEEKQRT